MTTIREGLLIVVGELRVVQSLLQEVFNVESEVRDLDNDPHLEIGDAGFEIWPSEGTRRTISRRIIVRTWDLFENVCIPSCDRDTPDDWDSLPRGTFNSPHEVVSAVMVALARQDIEGKLQAQGERDLADEFAHLGAQVFGG